MHVLVLVIGRLRLLLPVQPIYTMQFTDNYEKCDVNTSRWYVVTYERIHINSLLSIQIEHIVGEGYVYLSPSII